MSRAIACLRCKRVRRGQCHTMQILIHWNDDLRGHTARPGGLQSSEVETASRDVCQTLPPRNSPLCEPWDPHPDLPSWSPTRLTRHSIASGRHRAAAARDGRWRGPASRLGRNVNPGRRQRPARRCGGRAIALVIAAAVSRRYHARTIELSCSRYAPELTISSHHQRLHINHGSASQAACCWCQRLPTQYMAHLSAVTYFASLGRQN